MVHGPTAALLVTTEWLFLGTALLMIIARLYLHLKINHQRLSPSDYFLIIAWLASMSNACFDIAFLRLGILKPEMDVTLSLVEDPDILQQALRYFWATNFPFYTTLYMCKASVLALYLQLFPTHLGRLHCMLLYVVIGYSCAGYILSLGLVLLLCLPVERQWSLGPDMCDPSSMKVLARVGWTLHFSSDIFIFLLPFLILHKLQMKRLVKLGVYCTFGLGIINIAICLTRFLSVELVRANGLSLTLVSLWFLLDGNIGLIVACLPTLRPYLRIVRNRSYSSQSRTYKYGVVSRSKATIATAATGNSIRIEDVPEAGRIYVCTEVTQSARPVSPSDARDGFAWCKARTSASAPSSANCDETGSNIELVHVNSLER